MQETPPRLDPEASLGYQVRRCHRRFDRLLTAYLAQHGIKGGFWYYLRVLWQGEGLTQKHLSDVTNVAENTTVATLSAMERRGLIERVKDTIDRRKIRVTLTPEGRGLETRLIPFATHINVIAVEGIDPAEVAICLSVLQRAAANLQQAFDLQAFNIDTPPAP